MLKKETFVAYLFVAPALILFPGNPAILRVISQEKSNTDVTFSYEIAYVLIIGSPPMINTKDKNIYLSSPL